MDPDSRMALIDRRRDLGVAAVPADELVESGCREVAQDCVRAAGLYRREKAALERDGGVADRVDPAMHHMQSSAGDANFNSLVGEAAAPQVVRRDDAPLLGGEPREAGIRSSVDFSTSKGEK